MFFRRACNDKDPAGPDWKQGAAWARKVVSPHQALTHIEPGQSIFIGTGLAEPRALVRELLTSREPNLMDLELIQLISLGDALSIDERYPRKFRLKTFFSGWVADKAIIEGRVDLIPCPFSRIPRLIASGAIPLDAAFVQISPPNEEGWCSLGVAVDAARQAMDQAAYVVGEVGKSVPRTLGDTMVHASEFDVLVESTEEPILFPRSPVDPVFDKVARNVAGLVEDGSTLAFATGPLFEALGKHLAGKKDLNLHSPFLTDAAMDLIKCGAINNRHKPLYRGKSLVCYAIGSQELMDWLDGNPLVEFQGTDVVSDPWLVGGLKRFTTILPARKIDLTGNIALHAGRGNVYYGPGEAQDFFAGTRLSRGGKNICALPSRNLKGEPNIRTSIEEYANQVPVREMLDLVVTEYGVAALTGRTVRERALALIDIAHPDDRENLVCQARDDCILYSDQIVVTGAGHLFPEDLSYTHAIKGGATVKVRPIKPSDEEMMRRLFYRFSDETVYYRYFSPIKTMPHSKMQQYVNVDYSKTMSIVALSGDTGQERIVAEARYIRSDQGPFADVAFVVDEAYKGKGLGTHMYMKLIEIARSRGIQGFTADVLASNKTMLAVFEKAGFPIKSRYEEGAYQLTIFFNQPAT